MSKTNACRLEVAVGVAKHVQHDSFDNVGNSDFGTLHLLLLDIRECESSESTSILHPLWQLEERPNKTDEASAIVGPEVVTGRHSVVVEKKPQVKKEETPSPIIIEEDSSKNKLNIILWVVLIVIVNGAIIGFFFFGDETKALFGNDKTELQKQFF